MADVYGESRIEGLALSDGSRVDADVVVVGIGVVPNAEWLDGSGLVLDNGIVCNGSGEAAVNQPKALIKYRKLPAGHASWDTARRYQLKHRFSRMLSGKIVHASDRAI